MPLGEFDAQRFAILLNGRDVGVDQPGKFTGMRRQNATGVGATELIQLSRKGVQGIRVEDHRLADLGIQVRSQNLHSLRPAPPGADRPVPTSKRRGSG